MTRYRLVLAIGALLLAACESEDPPSGFAGLGALAASAEGFAQAMPEHTLAFPRDHGAHPDYRIEWWYLTANLTDDRGRPYGVQWTLFRSAQFPPGTESAASENNNPWQDPQVYMAHFAISTEREHVAFQRYARGGEHGGIARAGAIGKPFRAWLDDWQLQSAADGTADKLEENPSAADQTGRSSTLITWTPLELFARQGDHAAQLKLESNLPPLLQGLNGFSQKHPNGGGSHYYSQPFLNASGSLRIDGESVEVSGRAWLDREWSSQFLQPDQSGWDWFAIHLDSGEKLMLFQLRSENTDNFQHGVLIQPDGTRQTLAPSSLVLAPSRSSQVAERTIPTVWNIELPDVGRSLEVSALQPNQWMDVDFAYWEGPVVVRGETPGESGVGYLEMVGY